MSRLRLLSALAAAALFGGGASGLALTTPSETLPEKPAAQPSPLLVPVPASIGSHEPAISARTHHLLAGESLAATLLRAGVGGLDSALAAAAADGLDLQGGRKLRLWLGDKLPGGARALTRLEVRGSGSIVHILERTGDSFASRTEDRQVDDTPVRLRLSHGDRPAIALANSGLPDEVRSQVLAHAGTAPGTSIDLIAAHEEVDGNSAYGPLLYLAITSSSGQVRRWLGDEDGSLRPLTSGSSGLLRPVQGRVSSSPGLRLHPVLRFLRWHRGTDFAAPAGTPVRAALPGRVVEASWRGGYGNLVRLAHGDGTVTAYAHLSAFDVTPGEFVPQGALLGQVGETGLATGPHLHFEWLRQGKTLTPTFARAEPSLALDGRTRAALQALLAAPYRLPPRVSS